MLHWLFVRMKSEEQDKLGYKGLFICSVRIALLMELFPFSLVSWESCIAVVSLALQILNVIGVALRRFLYLDLFFLSSELETLIV